MSELSPRQVRALILLLIVAPLIPASLLLQLMVGAVRADRAADAERTGAFYDQCLHTAASAVLARLKADSAVGEPAATLQRRAGRYFEDCFAQGVKVRLTQPGERFAGSPPALAATTLEAPLRGWRVELFQDGPDLFAEGLQYQTHVFSLLAGGAILLNMTIAGLAGFALSRQLKVQELKSTSLETVSHELRTPLASMRVLLDTLLARKEGLAEPAGEYVRLISEENLRLIHLTESFLTLARLERGGSRFDRHPISPGELFDAARARVGEAQRDVRVEIAGDLPDVLVDREAVTVALANLIDNAIKYSDKEIRLRAMRETRGVEFQVIDHGIGIARAEQGRIFDRFYQVNQSLARTHKGCGLGLAIVKSIVTAHGGSVHVTSAEGEGTTVGVLLPVA